MGDLMLLPHELTSYIYEFLYLPRDILRFSLTNKYVGTLIPQQQRYLLQFMAKSHPLRNQINSIIYIELIPNTIIRRYNNTLHFMVVLEKSYILHINKYLLYITRDSADNLLQNYIIADIYYTTVDICKYLDDAIKRYGVDKDIINKLKKELR